MASMNFGIMGRCRVCRKEGHTRVTCPDLKEKQAAFELDLETGEMVPFEMVLTATIQHVEPSPPLAEKSGPAIAEEPAKRVEAEVMAKFDLPALLEKYRKTCSDCSGVTFCPRGTRCADCYYKDSAHCTLCAGEIRFIYRWGGDVVCSRCYNTEHEKLIDRICAYLSSRGMTECAFCKKSRTRLNGFHLDHINMFSKKDSVMKMVGYGEDYDMICAEVDKCQLLCIDCHQLVTGAELMCGFTYAKIRKLDETDLYSDVMRVVYERIRAART